MIKIKSFSELRDMVDLIGKSSGVNGVFHLDKRERYLYVNGEKAKIFMKPSLDCTRLIYIWHGVLFKIDVSKYLGNQSEKEVERYFKIEEEDRIYFPKPLDWGYFGEDNSWVAQEFVDLVAPEDESDLVWDLADKYKINDIVNNPKENAYYDIIAHNWALRENGLPFIYDFAS